MTLSVSEFVVTVNWCDDIGDWVLCDVESTLIEIEIRIQMIFKNIFVYCPLIITLKREKRI